MQHSMSTMQAGTSEHPTHPTLPGMLSHPFEVGLVDNLLFLGCRSVDKLLIPADTFIPYQEHPACHKVLFPLQLLPMSQICHPVDLLQSGLPHHMIKCNTCSNTVQWGT